MRYVTCQRNSYDRDGGDADLVYAINSIPEFIEVASNDTDFFVNQQKIYVQIKNKIGDDLGDTKGLDQLIKRAGNDGDALKILVSTADGFTDLCRGTAKKNNILLIDGKGLMKLAFKYLD